MAGERVDVCICTFRRSALAQSIRSLGRLSLKDVKLRVVVADNDDTPSGRAVAEAAAFEARLELAYVHAPARNVSLARNACLEASRSVWLAFIDDDEEVDEDWLARLLAAREGADIVFGPVRARYRKAAPSWLRRADLHSTSPPERRTLTTGYAGNVLINRAAIENAGLKFDLAFGVGGGEDTDFFYRAARAGLRLKFEPNAIAFEDVLPERESIRWLAGRRMAAGRAFGRCRHQLFQTSRAALAIGAVAKAASLGVMTLLTCVRPHIAARNGWRLGFHLGVLSYCLSAAGTERA